MMKKITILLALVLASLACSFSQEAGPSGMVTMTPDLIQTAMASVGQTMTAAAPRATSTPKATATQRPTETATIPPPNPVVIEGSGSTIIDVPDVFAEAFYLDIEEISDRIFSVDSYDATGNKIDNEVLAYQGYRGRKLYLQVSERVSRFEVSSNGNWRFIFYPMAMQYTHFADVPGTYTGDGDDVVWFKDNAGEVAFNFSSDRVFAVRTVNDDGDDLLILDQGPWSGRKILPPKSFVIIVSATGPWSAEFTSR